MIRMKNKNKDSLIEDSFLLVVQVVLILLTVVSLYIVNTHITFTTAQVIVNMGLTVVLLLTFYLTADNINTITSLNKRGKVQSSTKTSYKTKTLYKSKNYIIKEENGKKLYFCRNMEYNENRNPTLKNNKVKVQLATHNVPLGILEIIEELLERGDSV